MDVHVSVGLFSFFCRLKGDEVIMFNKVYSKAQRVSIPPDLNTHERE